MKKTYISPESLIVRLAPRSTVLTVVSYVGMDSTDGNKLGSSEILVKESSITDVNLWDDEW